DQCRDAANLVRLAQELRVELYATRGALLTRHTGADDCTSGLPFALPVAQIAQDQVMAVAAHASFPMAPETAPSLFMQVEDEGIAQRLDQRDGTADGHATRQRVDHQKRRGEMQNREGEGFQQGFFTTHRSSSRARIQPTRNVAAMPDRARPATFPLDKPLSAWLPLPA